MANLSMNPWGFVALLAAHFEDGFTLVRRTERVPDPGREPAAAPVVWEAVRHAHPGVAGWVRARLLGGDRTSAVQDGA